MTFNRSTRTPLLDALLFGTRRLSQVSRTSLAVFLLGWLAALGVSFQIGLTLVR